MSEPEVKSSNDLFSMMNSPKASGRKEVNPDIQPASIWHDKNCIND